MKEKNLKDNKKTLINKLVSKDDSDEEIKKLKALKRKIKKIKTVEELAEVESELEKIGLLDEILSDIDDKKKKKRRKTDREIFEERVRVSLDIINRTVMVGKLFKSKERDKKIEKLFNRNENVGEHSQIPEDRIRDKDKEQEKEDREFRIKKVKERGERSR